MHRKQYIVGPRAVPIRDDWKSINLGQDLVLSYCPALPVRIVASSNDHNTRFLLGTAIRIDGASSTPVDDLRAATTSGLPTTTERWMGRWALVAANQLTMDASGMIGCYYAHHHNERWASSSLPVLKHAVGQFSNLVTRPRTKSGINWDPPPNTRYENIRRLLPSQTLNLSTHAIKHRPLLQSGVQDRPYDEVLHEIEALLVTTFERVQEMADRVFITVTDGYDSRLTLAAAHAANIPARGFTFSNAIFRTGIAGLDERLNPDIDRRLPSKLAGAVGIPHTVVPRGRYDAEVDQSFERHTMNAAMDYSARSRFQYGQINVGQTERDYIMKGGGFEVGRCFYWTQLSEAVPTAEVIVERLDPSERNNPIVLNGLREWLEWVHATPVSGLDWRDRFYWEQRFGGWQSAVNQADCMADGTWLNMATSGYLYQLLLSVPEAKRGKSEHHVDLIRRLAPRLLEFPFNPTDGVVKRGLRKAVRKRGLRKAVRLLGGTP